MSGLVKKVKNALLVSAAVVVPLVGISSYFVPDTVVTKVIDTQTKRSNSKDKYLIFTEAGVFENTDAWYRFKFRSSDLQGRIMQLKGKEVEITKYGWRFGPLSWYENVVDIN